MSAYIISKDERRVRAVILPKEEPVNPTSKILKIRHGNILKTIYKIDKLTRKLNQGPYFLPFPKCSNSTAASESLFTRMFQALTALFLYLIFIFF